MASPGNRTPRRLPFVGSPPKLHPLLAATPHSRKEGLESISLRLAHLALPKPVIFFFFLAGPVPSETRVTRRRDTVENGGLGGRRLGGRGIAAMQLGVDFGVREKKEGGGRDGAGCERLSVFHVNRQSSPGG